MTLLDLDTIIEILEHLDSMTLHFKRDTEDSLREKSLDFTPSLLEHLLRLSQIDLTESTYAAGRPGATVADCIGFLYQQKGLLPGGLPAKIQGKVYDSCIAHLQELHGRRQAADKEKNAQREQRQKQYDERRKKEETQYHSAFHDFGEEFYQTKYNHSEGFTAFEDLFRNYKEAVEKAQGPKPWYEILGVPAKANRETIQKAWRVLAKKHHPDRVGGSNEMMSQINKARDEGLKLL